MEQKGHSFIAFLFVAHKVNIEGSVSNDEVQLAGAYRCTQSLVNVTSVSLAWAPLSGECNDEGTADRLSAEVTDALCYIILSGSHGCFIAELCDGAEPKPVLTVNVS